MLLARRKPHHVAGPDLLDRPALALHPAAAGGDDQGLAERIRMPRRARAGFERDERAPLTRAGSGALEQRIDPDGAGRTTPLAPSQKARDART